MQVNLYTPQEVSIKFIQQVNKYFRNLEMLSNIIFETYLLYKFNDVLQTLSHVNYQYLDISLANRIRGKRKRVEEKKGSFRNVYLKNPNSINLSVFTCRSKSSIQ